MKAIAGLSEQQDRDLASAPVFCFVAEEQCAHPGLLDRARGDGPDGGGRAAGIERLTGRQDGFQKHGSK
jgi:hypothetical protein